MGDVQRPGSKGGRWYRTRTGRIRYGPPPYGAGVRGGRGRRWGDIPHTGRAPQVWIEERSERVYLMGDPGYMRHVVESHPALRWDREMRAWWAPKGDRDVVRILGESLMGPRLKYVRDQSQPDTAAPRLSRREQIRRRLAGALRLIQGKPSGGALRHVARLLTGDGVMHFYLQGDDVYARHAYQTPRHDVAYGWESRENWYRLEGITPTDIAEAIDAWVLSRP